MPFGSYLLNISFPGSKPTFPHTPSSSQNTVLVWWCHFALHPEEEWSGKNPSYSQNLLNSNRDLYLLSLCAEEPSTASKVTVFFSWPSLHQRLSGDFNHRDDPNKLQAYQLGMNVLKPPVVILHGDKILSSFDTDIYSRLELCLDPISSNTKRPCSTRHQKKG